MMLFITVKIPLKGFIITFLQKCNQPKKRNLLFRFCLFLYK